MSKIIKTELDTTVFLIEYLNENVRGYYCVQRASNLIELLERLNRERLQRKRLNRERIIFKIIGII